MPHHLNQIREALAKYQYDAIIIPTDDPHSSEYVCDHFKAREYFSGFTGSAGILAVTAERAALWTDSRYFIQAEMELEGSGIELMRQGVAGTPTIDKWIKGCIRRNGSIVIPGELFSSSDVSLFNSAFLGYYVFSETDLISPAWPDRPPMPTAKAFVHEDKYAGESASSKISRLRKTIESLGGEVYIITALDEVAWLYNIRGNDIEYNPLVYSYAIIDNEDAYLFIDKSKCTPELESHCNESNIHILEYNRFSDYLDGLNHKKVFIDKEHTNYSIYSSVSRTNKVFYIQSPVDKMKAVKNDTQIKGTRLAMEKDGVALVRFWMWLEKALSSGVMVTELSAAEMLRHFRSEQAEFMGESFETIVGYADHGAIVHYSATEKTNTEIKNGNLLLIDSGAQFPHGTTDVTRTFALGDIAAEAKRDFTLVLKGHIALASAIFPAGTGGYNIDILAKQYLWKNGLTYGHGTGHGVGHFLCVHEGPQNISPRTSSAPLVPGMITSDEPGYYKEGCYGIRHENLTLVVNKTFDNSDAQFLGFEVLTLCPFDVNGIEIALLSNDEKQWINDYHAEVLRRLSPMLEKEEKAWLAKKCQAI